MINEKTLIPISLAITLMGGVVWVTNIYSKTIENSERISRLEVEQDTFMGLLRSVDQRLSRIEGKLGIK